MEQSASNKYAMVNVGSIPYAIASVMHYMVYISLPHDYMLCILDMWCTCMTKLYGYDRMTMVQYLIKGYIESTQSRIVIVMYIDIYQF